MRIAVVLFPRVTALDAIGPYEVLQRLPEATVTFVGHRRGEIRTENGFLGLSIDATFDELTGPDVVVVPGGIGSRQLLKDDVVLDWLRTAHATSRFTTSVCTGSLILAAAGLLEGRRATSHWLAIDELRRLGAVPVSERVVFDGKMVTAAGVSAGIDMALTLASRVAGDQVAQAIQLGIEYDPQPPFQAGSPQKAPAEIVALLSGSSRFAQADR
jgi:putative intracellular protease/amidase